MANDQFEALRRLDECHGCAAAMQWRSNIDMSEGCGNVRRATRRRLVGSMVVGTSMTLLGHAGQSSETAGAQERNYRIVLIPGSGGRDFFFIPMACGAQAAAAATGVRLDVLGPVAFDSTVQAPLLASVVDSRPDAILIVPTDRTAMIAPIQEAVDSGIPVFTLDNAIDADLALAHIASDNVEGGRIAARALAEALGGTGKVFVVNVAPWISSTTQREEGFAKVIATYPGMEYLGQAFDDNLQERATGIVRDKLREVPDLAGIFAANLWAGQGAAIAVAQAGAADRVTLIAFDASPDQVEQLRAGSVDALIAQHPAEMGYRGVQIAVAYLDTKTPPTEKVVATGYTVVTRDNVDDSNVARHIYVLNCNEIPAASPTPE